MSHLYLGAINKINSEYVSPNLANKKNKYECPGCNNDVFPRQGKILRPHFAHKKSDNPCNYYNHPGESQIHKEGKMLIKMLIEKNIDISIIRPCLCCKKNNIFEIPKLDEGSVIQLEHPIEFNGRKVLDVAYIKNGKIEFIFEICNTHKTCSENRPNDIEWFEIDAETLIKLSNQIDAETLIELANENNSTSFQIPCIRREKCNDCIEKEKIQEKQIQIYKEKNTRYLIRKLNTENFVYLNINYSNKDFVKNKDLVKKLGGKWNNDCKLWYISYDKYKKNKNLLDMFKIFWKCKDCEDMEKIGVEEGCHECWKESVGWIDSDYF
jgi:hypothetical protein